MNERYEWDSRKALENRRKHGVPFDLVHAFDWDTALVLDDDDHDEYRGRALGRIGDKLFALAFTLRGDAIRVISLRRAEPREKRIYGG